MFWSTSVPNFMLVDKCAQKIPKPPDYSVKRFFEEQRLVGAARVPRQQNRPRIRSKNAFQGKRPLLSAYGEARYFSVAVSVWA